jgi:hypothetical protein
MPTNKQEILTQHIQDLPFTVEFKLFEQKLGVIAVWEMLAMPVATIMKSEGFTLHALQEWVQFLEIRGIGNLIIQ